MVKKYETSEDYRELADQLWEMSRKESKHGHYDLASHLMAMSDNMHNLARKKEEVENLLKNSN